MGKSIVVGLTGASGQIYAARLLAALERASDVDTVHLVASRHARTALSAELELAPTGPLDLERLAGRAARKTREHPIDAVDACISSGSFRTAGMVVVPCSLGTAGRIAHGISDTLLTRAADVHLKERRPLLLVVRESPLSAIHLESLLALARAGAVVMPAMPGFYHRPRSLEELVDQFLARVLDHLGVTHDLGRRWAGPQRD